MSKPLKVQSAGKPPRNKLDELKALVSALPA